MRYVAVVFAIVQLSAAVHAADLLDVYRSAVQSDPQIREANDARLTARESKPRALAALLPQLTGAGSYSRETDTGNQDQVETVQDVGGPSFVESFPFSGKIVTNKRQFGVDLKQSVFRWENWVALRRADSQVAEAEADYEIARQDLIARVAQSYFDVLASQDLLAAQQVALTSIDRQLFQAEKRYDAGVIGITDVEQAKASHDSAAAEVISAKRQLASAKEVLREITGTSFESLARPVDSLELANPNPANEDEWVALALQQNPTLVSSRLAADVANERVKEAYGGHLPSLDLIASRYKVVSDGTFTNTDGSPFGDTTLDQYQNKIAIQFSIPIFSGGAVSSQVREQVYQHRAAKDKVERVTRQVEHDARDAYQGVLTEISRVNALQRALESSNTALHATELGYEAGTRSSADILESRRLWIQAKTDYSRSRYDYMRNVLKLQQAAGMLSIDSLSKLNAQLDASLPTNQDH